MHEADSIGSIEVSSGMYRQARMNALVIGLIAFSVLGLLIASQLLLARASSYGELRNALIAFGAFCAGVLVLMLGPLALLAVAVYLVAAVAMLKRRSAHGSPSE